jgi:hypothetical protein
MRRIIGALCLGLTACLAADRVGPEHESFNAHFGVWPRWAAALPGDSLQLTAGLADTAGEIMQNLLVRWRSSDSTIAKVDSRGLVHAYRLGTVTVEASLGDSLQELTVLVAPPVLVGAGDIASCQSTADEATAAILDTVPGIVIAPGDIAYETGSDDDFAKCYAPSWGRHRARTRPAPGNHEYLTPGASPYYKYFGANAGNPGQGYYSYDVADWHVVVVNSSADVGPNSPQLRWLLKDLATDTARCTVAYWHHPLFSSGPNGSAVRMREVWRALYNLGGDIIINGHDHVYERFAPQDPSANPDSIHGIRQFTVGTGGRSLYPLSSTRAKNSVVASSATYGVLKLTLHPSSYDWVFIPVTPGTFEDSGTANCHS